MITKRRLAGLVSASAIIAAMAVTATPIATLAAPSLDDWPLDQQRVQLNPQQGVRECPEHGFEATSTKELGDIVGLGGTARKLSSMSVVFSSWARQAGATGTDGDCVTTPGATFNVPMTSTSMTTRTASRAGTLATKTQTVAMATDPRRAPAAHRTASGTTRRIRSATTA